MFSPPEAMGVHPMGTDRHSSMQQGSGPVASAIRPLVLSLTCYLFPSRFNFYPQRASLLVQWLSALATQGMQDESLVGAKAPHAAGKAISR